MTTVVKGEYRVVPLSLLEHDTDNCRKELVHIEELASDIRSNKLINPLSVMLIGGKYVVKAGNRRLAALRLLKAEEVPVIIIPSDESDADIVQLAENISREDLHPIDLAERLFQLRDPSRPNRFTSKQLAERLGKSVPHVDNLVRVAKRLCPEVKKLARESEIVPRLRFLFLWASLDPQDQVKAFNKWAKIQSKLEKEPQEKEADSEETSTGKTTKKVDFILNSKQLKIVEPYREVLAWKSNQVRGAAEKARYEGALEVLNFFIGDAKKFALVSQGDFKAFAKEKREQEEEEEGEGEEVEQ